MAKSKKLKLTRNPRLEVPSDYGIESFQYQGRPAKDQDDFGEDVGIADMVHIDQEGETVSPEYAPDGSNKYYHGGVVQSMDDDSWWVYLEWGTASLTEQSWQNGDFRPDQEAEQCAFQFVECDDEEQARLYFQQVMQAKNIERLTQKKVGRQQIWTSKKKRGKKNEYEEGYVVQDLASRSRGLPHAYTILKAKKTGAKKSRSRKKKRSSSNVDPKVSKLATDLVGGTHQYTQLLMAQSSGLVPTLEAIEEVRNDLLPEALKLINDLKKRRNAKKKSELVDISEFIATKIPRPIPSNASKSARQKAIVLSDKNIPSLEQDMDAFEAMIESDLLDQSNIHDVDSTALLNADVEWINPRSTFGKWLYAQYEGMSRPHRQPNIDILNIFRIERKRTDTAFMKEVGKLAKKHKNKSLVGGDAQPRTRKDISEYSSSSYEDANIIMGFHGTRGVNIQPILSTNLRMPTWSGLYGQGIYFATDWAKSYGYCQELTSRSSNFMFICDVAIGMPYVTSGCGSWTVAPGKNDSVFFQCAVNSRDDNEHIIFNPFHQRIRYLVEFRC